LRLSYDQARTWSDGGGGFYPPSGQSYAAQNSALALDRGKVCFGRRMDAGNGPKVTFKYTHSFRDGDEGSTGVGVRPSGRERSRGRTQPIA